MTLHDEILYVEDYKLRDKKDVHSAVRVAVVEVPKLKEAVKKLKKELCIHGVMYEHEVPCKCMNCECIKEIFGEGLIKEQGK